MSALAGVLLAWVHAAYYLPTGVFGILFFAALSEPAQSAKVLSLYHQLYLCSMCVSSVANLPDLLVYLFMFPAFRARAGEIICFWRQRTNSTSRNEQLFVRVTALKSRDLALPLGLGDENIERNKQEAKPSD